MLSCNKSRNISPEKTHIVCSTKQINLGLEMCHKNMNDKQIRGELTQRVIDKAKDMLGIKLTVTELRLMPYIQYVMMNDRCIYADKVNEMELAIIAEWQGRGWISGDIYNDMHISKEFWFAIADILYLAYIDLN